MYTGKADVSTSYSSKQLLYSISGRSELDIRQECRQKPCVEKHHQQLAALQQGCGFKEMQASANGLMGNLT